MAEVYLGRRLFPDTGHLTERLALLERIIGPFPEDLAARAEEITPGTFELLPGSSPKVRFPTVGGPSHSPQVARNVLESSALSVGHTLVLLIVSGLTTLIRASYTTATSTTSAEKL